jgi:hypothetical protein
MCPGGFSLGIKGLTEKLPLRGMYIPVKGLPIGVDMDPEGKLLPRPKLSPRRPPYDLVYG